MERTINGKVYQIKDITYMQALEVEEAKITGIKEAAKKFIQFSTGLSDEEVNNLSMKDGLELQKAINQINELDFQKPAEK